MDWAWGHASEMTAMGQAARTEYEARYACDRNYLQLIDIYNRVLGKNSEIPSESPAMMLQSG